MQLHRDAPAAAGASALAERLDNVVPRDLYDNPDLFPLEMERIFRGPLWHPVGHRAEIPNPLDFKTFFVGDVPIVVNHGKDGKIRGFLNACAHRGTMVETRARGNSRIFHCPYHRWSYDAQGALTACPGEDDFPPSFKRENFGLKTVRVEESCGFIFVTLHPDTPPLAESLGGVTENLSRHFDADMKLLGYQKVLYNCNWKVYVDQDGYHPPLLHAAFRLINWQGGKGSNVGTDHGHIAFEYETGPYKDNGFLKDPSVVQVKSPGKLGGQVIFLFPLTIVTTHLDMLNPRFVRPVDADHVEVHFAYLSKKTDDAALEDHRVKQSANLLGPSGLISLDDATVFLRIQKAAKSNMPNTFLKGVRDDSDPRFAAQNSELTNLLWWRVYRQHMGL